MHPPWEVGILHRVLPPAAGFGGQPQTSVYLYKLVNLLATIPSDTWQAINLSACDRSPSSFPELERVCFISFAALPRACPHPMSYLAVSRKGQSALSLFTCFP